MIYLYLYLGGFFLLVAGYMFGRRDERKNGPAACQKIMDQELAEYHEESAKWDDAKQRGVVKLDNEPASKRIKQYGHLRLIK